MSRNKSLKRKKGKENLRGKGGFFFPKETRTEKITNRQKITKDLTKAKGRLQRKKESLYKSPSANCVAKKGKRSLLARGKEAGKEHSSIFRRGQAYPEGMERENKEKWTGHLFAGRRKGRRMKRKENNNFLGWRRVNTI